MLLLSAVNVLRQFDREPVLNNVTFDIQQGERIGLVGPNGAGKTTLLKILVGSDHADSGQLSLASGATVSLLEQQPDFAPGRTLRQEAETGLADILRLQHEAAELAQRMSQESDPDQQ